MFEKQDKEINTIMVRLFQLISSRWDVKITSNSFHESCVYVLLFADLLYSEDLYKQFSRGSCPYD